MDQTDPYYPVQDEVIKSLQTTEDVYHDWMKSHPIRSELTNSLKQLIRGIEWDLEDIQETISIVQSNPSKFHLSASDISERERFVRETRSILESVKAQVDLGNKRIADKQIVFNVSAAKSPSSVKQNGIAAPYLESSKEQSAYQTTVIHGRHSRPTVLPVNTDPLSHQELLLRDQDSRLDQLGSSISALKGMSQRIGEELGDQVGLLEEFNSEMLHTESRLDAVTKRTARLLHLSTDRRQWWAIITLTLTLLVILILLVVL